jgi:hypothetical protein
LSFCFASAHRSFFPSSSISCICAFIYFFLILFPLQFFLSSSIPCLLAVSFNKNLQWKYPKSGVSVPYREYPKLVCDMQYSMLCLHARHEQKILEFFVQYFLWIECVKFLLFL